MFSLICFLVVANKCPVQAFSSVTKLSHLNSLAGTAIVNLLKDSRRMFLLVEYQDDSMSSL